MIATVVGNYPKIPNRPRPARLRTALARLDRGEITQEQLKAVQDEVTVEVIEEQVRAGLDLITDGQIRWDDGQTYFASRLDGVRIGGLIRYFDTNTYFRQPIIEGPVRWREPISVSDFVFAKSKSPVPVKAVITGPLTLAALSVDSHYGDFEKLALDIAAALNEEALALQEAGAEFIQFDEPVVAVQKQEPWTVGRALSRALKGLRAKKAVYTYFGSVDGVYDELVRLPVDVVGLDMVTAPENYSLVLERSAPVEVGAGVVNARNTKMEEAEELCEKVLKLAERVGPERLYVNPSCGLEFLPRERAYDKLERMVEAVRMAESRLQL